MDTANLTRLVNDWADADPDPSTASELRTLLSRGDWKELEDRFSQPLEFGTAGLRGVLGGGPNRMNRAVVRRTAKGLAQYLKQNAPAVLEQGVVIGRDGRLLSKEFAEDTAAVLAAEGIAALVFEAVAPTPVTAFALLHLKAAAAVMVTASHNPPEYNGYKVYWANGAQIVSPLELGLAAAIAGVGAAKDVPLLPEREARARGLWRDVPASVERAYLDAILALRPTRHTQELRIVYTAMHGVGGRWVAQALAEAGFTEFFTVAEQQEPDGRFPTVRFPNPEEKGAMDLASRRAAQTEAELVLANDPDADRLAVMARDGTGALRMLTGNEVGVLLGHFLLTQTKAQNPLVITTIVSSAQLGGIAKALGAGYDETLTGFKWIANKAMERQGESFVMGYEEALGYTVGTVARDKDGVGTALVVADMAAWCKRRGVSLFGYLEEVQREHGLFVAKQANFTLPGASGASTIRAVMQAFRERPPEAFGPRPVQQTQDYAQGLRGMPASNVLAYQLDGGARVTLRPSGTEPKIKFYVEHRHAMQPGEDMASAKQAAAQALDALEAAVLAQARERGLT